MEVVMIRHTSVAVPRGTCYGWSDVPVADTFETEAAQTRRQLTGTFDRVFSSPLTRARKLAAYCGFEHPTVDERLREMNMGQWEMRRYEDIEREDPYIWKWYDDYMHLPTTGGEGFPDIYRRVADFLDELRQQPLRRVAIFAHGGVLVCGGLYAGLFSREHAYDHLVPYGGLQVVNI